MFRQGTAILVFLLLVVIGVHGFEIRDDCNTVRIPTLSTPGNRNTPGSTLVAGHSHTCMVQHSLLVKCWGDNSELQSSAPNTVFPTSLMKYVAVSAGRAHTCIMAVYGVPVCFGDNAFEQSNAPLTAEYVSIVAGHDHSCGILNTGEASCFGKNTHGETVPPENGRFLELALGNEHSCGIQYDNTVVCWGNNTYGQSTPPAVPFARIAASDGYTCGITGLGSIICWGKHTDFTFAGNNYAQISTGPEHMCALTTLKTVVCVGNSSYAVPADLTDVVTVACGWRHSCVQFSNGSLACFGDNDKGQSSPPQPTAIKKIASSTGAACFLYEDGAGYCYSDYLGIANIPYTGKFLDIGMGVRENACALKEDGLPICWGKPGSPVLTVTGIPALAKLSVGYDSACGLTAVGKLHCWGNFAMLKLLKPEIFQGVYKDVSLGYEGACLIDVLSSSVTCAYVSGSSVVMVVPPQFYQNGKAVQCHGYTCCALSATGAIGCFPLGPTVSPSLMPTLPGVYASVYMSSLIPDTIRFTETSGVYVCGIQADGQMKCASSGSPKFVMPDFDPAARFKTIGAGSFQMCTVSLHGEANCWYESVDIGMGLQTFRFGGDYDSARCEVQQTRVFGPTGTNNYFCGNPGFLPCDSLSSATGRSELPGGFVTFLGTPGTYNMTTLNLASAYTVIRPLDYAYPTLPPQLPLPHRPPTLDFDCRGATCVNVLKGGVQLVNIRFSNGFVAASVGSNLGPVDFIDCVFEHNTGSRASFGSALTVGFGSQVFLLRSLFNDNYSGGDGAGLFVAYALAVVTQCTFRNNKCDDGGAAVFAVSSSLRFDYCVFDSNTASQGGAVGLFRGTALIASSSFSNNTALQGGALMLDSSRGSVNNETWFNQALIGKNTVSAILNSQFAGNKASQGGAVLLQGSEMMVNNTHFTSNVALSDESAAGGAISMTASAIFVAYSHLTNNTAVLGSSMSNLNTDALSGNMLRFGGGGALACQLGSLPSSIVATHLVQNRVLGGGYGAALHVDRCTFAIQNANMTQNAAAGSGGGVILAAESQLQLMDSLAVGNTAKYGGVLFMFGGVAQVTGSMFQYNTAQSGAVAFASNLAVPLVLGLPALGNIFAFNTAGYASDAAVGSTISRLVLSQQPGTTVPQSAKVPLTFVVELQDTAGQRISSDMDTLVVASPAAETALSISGRTEVKAVSGLANFSLACGGVSQAHAITFRTSTFLFDGTLVQLEAQAPFVLRECTAGEEFSLDYCRQCSSGYYSSSGQSCELCPAGRWSNDIGATECTPCQNGTASEVLGRQIPCTECRAGFYAEEAGQTSCVQCAPGSYSLSQSSVCTPCPRGRYIAGSGYSSCQDCEAGSFTDEVGKSECSLCPPGHYQSAAGQSTCVKCSAGSFASSSKNALCSLCPRGRFSSNNGSTVCVECEAGDYAMDMGLTACSACALGSVSNRGAFSCQPCLSGTFHNVSESACSHCPPGFRNPATGVTVCEACQAGHFARSPGSIVCEEAVRGYYTNAPAASQPEACPLGYFSPDTAATSCSKCAAGQFSGAVGSSTCSKCPSRSVAPASGASSCVSCPTGSTSNDAFVCICDIGYYQANSTTFSCVPCPKGARCETVGITADSIPTSSGWWRSPESAQFYHCIHDSHCAGGVMAECGANREGPLCALCKPGYAAASSDSECKPCPTQTSSSLSLTFLLLFFVCGLLVLYYIVGKNAMASATQIAYAAKHEAFVRHNTNFVLTKELRMPPNFTFSIKIFISFLQICSSMVFMQTEIPWPSYFRAFISFFDFVNIDLVPWSSLSCVATIDYYTRLLVITILPVGILIVLTIIFFLAMAILDWRDFADESAARAARSRWRVVYVRLVCFTLFLIFPGVSSRVLGFFVCKEVDGERYLLSDFTLRCGSETYNQFLPFSSVMIALYPVGIPALFLTFLIRSRERLQRAKTKAALGFLYEAYAGNMWWFEMVDIAHKLLITSILAFLPLDLQLPGGMVVAGLYLVIITVTQPYARWRDDVLAMLAQVEMLALMLAGLVMMRGGVNSEPDSSSDIALSVFLLIAAAIFIFLFFYFAAKFVRDIYWGEIKRRFRKQNNNNNSNAKSGGTSSSSSPGIELQSAHDLEEDEVQFDAGRRVSALALPAIELPEVKWDQPDEPEVEAETGEGIEPGQ